MSVVVGIGISPIFTQTSSEILSYGEQKILPLNPVAYWSMDQTSGVGVIDSSGNNHEARAIGLTWVYDATLDKYVSFFDGINDYIDLLLNSSGVANGIPTAWDEDKGTLIFWTKIFNVSQWTDGVIGYFAGYLASGSDNANINYQKRNVNNQFQYLATNLAGSHSIAYNTSDWFMTAVSWSSNNNRLRYYLSNTALISDTYVLGSRFGNNLTQMKLGSDRAATTFLKCYISDCAFWDIELSQAQIADLMIR